MKKNIASVVVSYNPDYRIVENVFVLAEQVDLVIVVDNGSGKDSINHLDRLKDSKNIKIKFNSENLGIASALNIGVKYLIEAGYLWIATFDQDTTLTSGCIASMLKAYEACNFKEKVALISPTYFFPSTGEFSKAQSCVDNCFPFAIVETAITSGSLVKSTIFEEVGFFREDLFIDYVDNEFCLRCSKRGYKIIQACDSVIQHTIGEPTRKSFLWKKPLVTNHNHTRVYYGARNRVFVYKTYFFSNISWVVEDFLRYIKTMIRVVILEENSAKKLYFMLLGLFHGFIGRMGKYQ